ncbi:MAG: ABC transporter permease [Ignavibacteria bacterium]|jgi:peptide/nickel transport system permease protein|nr:ABC transporter permease [Ignavibacteria bacterium]
MMNRLLYPAVKRFKRHKLAFTAFYVLIFMILVAVFSGIISPYSPDRQILEFSSKGIFFSSDVINVKENSGTAVVPVKNIVKENEKSITIIDYADNLKDFEKTEIIMNGSEYISRMNFILGTDKFGRDILSRLIYGTRISVSVGIISQIIALFIGIILGSIAGFYRGTSDKVIMWFINVVWAFPSILLVIAISVVLGKGYWQAFVAIGLTSWIDIARITRGQLFSIRESEYVEAARSLGISDMKIIVKHIIPNSISPIIITSTVGLANAVIFEASLSFLGMGVQPPTASWGQMVFDGYKYLITGTNYNLVLFPSLAIMLLVFSINMVGDGLRDSLDPKIKKI